MNTEIIAHVNWLAVLVAGLAYFILRALWYSALFGKKWQSYNSSLMADPDAKKGAAEIMVLSLILMLGCSSGLALIITRLDVSGWLSGLEIGLITGICCSATAIHISYIYEKRPLGLHLINGLYNVAGNIIAAIIISCWR
ncbi:MAG: DUF1761 domain-containing protein [Bacteroidota bacterium]|nr:DUF1761 domain-containing protein [Bacteroidota bacterium]